MTAGLAAERIEADAAKTTRMLELSRRAAELREELPGLADEDVAAYGEVARAPDARVRAEALSAASEPPLAIAELAAELAEAASEIAAAGEWTFRPDAVVAAELAAAAALGCAELVAANLADDGRDPRTGRARAAAERGRLAGDAAARLTG